MEKKEKQYVSDNTQLMEEWDWEENISLSPYTLAYSSNKKVSWKCKAGHKWEATIAHRTRRGSGCPYCSGRLAIPGETDLATTYPELAAEWHPTKNGALLPSTTTISSGKMVWWKCARGHEWEATVINRSKRKSGCPFCSGRKVIPGITDLATTNPRLAAEWHPALNAGLTPHDISAGSSKKVWWKCHVCGNEWNAAVYSRTAGRGCSVCSEQQKKITLNTNRLSNTGSLLEVNPELAAEWHPSKNRDLLPSQVLPNSNLKVWWRCRKGHEWEAVIQSRNKGIGCPQCSNELQTSFPEQVIFYYLSKLTTTCNRYNIAPRTEIDVFLPEYKIAIEYDGIRFHKGAKAQEKELRKNRLLSEMGIMLFRVKETEDINGVVDAPNIIYCKYSSNYAYLNDVMSKLLARISDYQGTKFEIDVNVERDRAEIYEQYIDMEKENSLLIKRPLIAAEWHPTKNGDLLPSHVTEFSNKVVWWKCAEGHEWEISVNHRSNGSGCPICGKIRGGEKRTASFVAKRGSLSSKLPYLAAEWHPTKNEGLLPTDVTVSSNKRAWWLCPNCGHEWNAIICSRSRGNGCPNCANLKRKHRQKESE